MASRPRDAETESSSFDETIEGVGTWTGVVAESADLRRRFAGRTPGFFELLERQIARYRWFLTKIETPRGPDACARVLGRRRRSPGAWERAMVELTLADGMRAELVLEEWEPPADEPELELFRRVCLVSLGERGGI